MPLLPACWTTSQNVTAPKPQEDVEELSGSLAQGGDVGTDAYKRILNALKNVDDDSQRYQAGVQLFGTMWEDLGEDAVYALMDTQGAITSTNDAMAEADGAAYDDVGNTVSELGRKFESDILFPLRDNIMPVVNDIGKFFIDNWSGISPIISGIAVAFVGLPVRMSLLQNYTGIRKMLTKLDYQSECHCSKTLRQSHDQYHMTKPVSLNSFVRYISSSLRIK